MYRSIAAFRCTRYRAVDGSKAVPTEHYGSEGAYATSKSCLGIATTDALCAGARRNFAESESGIW